MFEDNPLYLENIKEIQDHDEKLMQSAVKTQSGTVASLSTMLKTSCVTLNQVTGHPGSKRLYGKLGKRYHHRDLH
jgi:hypothetical protein